MAVKDFGGLDQFVASSPIATAMFDREMRYIAASQRWLGMFGRRETPVGHSHYEDVPEISDAWKAVHRRCLAGASESSEGERLAHAGGGVKWVTWRARPWTNRGGAVGGIVISGEDITAKVEAQEKADGLARRLAVAVEELEGAARRAQEAEQRLKDAVEAIPGGFAIYDADDRLLVCNEANRDMFPYLAEELRPGVSYEHLLRAGFDRGHYGRFIADKESWLRERMERRRNPGGAVEQLTILGRWLRVEERRMPDGGVVAIRTDITDLKTRERDFALKAALLEATLHNIGEGVLVYDANRKLLVANAFAVRLLDLPPELCQPGVSLDDLARFRVLRGDHGEVGDVEAHVGERAAWFRARRPFARTRRLNDGRALDTRFVPTPGGGAMFVFRDSTERADNEAKLAQKTALLEATFQNIGEGIAVFDADGKLLAGNDLAARLLAAPKALFRPGTALGDLIRFRAVRGDYGPVAVDETVQQRMAEFHARKSWRGVWRRLDGCLIEARIAPMPDLGAILVLQDVTERAEQEAKLTNALARAERASQAKSEFLATVSHEVRTPMNTIIGLSDLLREHHLEPKERRYASAIEAAGESLLVIIDDLLEFASLDTGQTVLDKAPVDVRAVAASAIDIARALPRAEGLAIRAEIDAAVPAALLGDGGHIRRILVSLLDNAVKHTANGAVTLRAHAGPADGAEKILLRIEVEDTGTGFAPAEASRLFQPFERGSSDDHTPAAGLGLGLAICQKLVDLMGGTIGAESKPGAGSRFWLEIPLPVAAPLAPREPASPHVLNARRPLKVLVAEDIEANRTVMGAMLEKLGHEAHFAEDGAKAIEAVRKDDYDAILMDIKMPNIDGLEATRAIRRFGGRMANVPIFAVSAFYLPAHKAAAMKAGATGFLPKPVRKSELDEALRSVFGGQPDGERRAATWEKPDALKDASENA